MRDSYIKQLKKLHEDLTDMGKMCEEAIRFAIKGLLEKDSDLRGKAVLIEKEIDIKEREIEGFCMRLIMREQPVAGDLRAITAAMKIVTDMERIGDHAEDIAEISVFLDKTDVQSDVHIENMTEAALTMLTDAIDAFVSRDLEKIKAVMAFDDVLDECFARIRGELVAHLTRVPEDAAACLDLLMIAKYLERIGDHAKNIAEWVEFALTGLIRGKAVVGKSE